MRKTPFICLVFLLLFVSSAFAWWDSGWTKRKAITLTTTSGSTPAGYQVKLNITYDSDMKVDFSDLRFVASDDITLLNAWLESKSDGNWSVVWVKVTGPITTSGTIIYMYYNNSVATNYWDGDATFEFFDDFEGTSLDTNKWSIVTGTWQVSNGWLESTSSSYQQIRTNSYQTDSTSVVNYRVETETSVYWNTVVVNGNTGAYNSNLNGYLIYNDFGASPQQADIYRETGTSFTKLDSNTDISTGTFDFEVITTSTNIIVKRDGADYLSASDTTYRGGYIHFVEAGANDGKLDYIFVHKYADTEPTASFGAEEEAGNLVTVSAYDEDNTAEHVNTFTIAWINKTWSTTNGTIEINTTVDYGAGFMVAQADGYKTRQLFENITQYGSKTIIFYLLNETKGEDLQMRIADPDNTSYFLPNELVTLKLGANPLTQKYTDSDGYITFFGNWSKNYCVEYSNNSFCNNLTITVKQPIDEKNPSVKVANYTLIVTGPVSYSQQNLNGDETFTTYVFKGYTMIHVENSSYVGRNYYIKKAIVGQNSTIQPYLLRYGDGNWNTFVVIDENQNPLTDVYGTFFRQINGAYQVIGQIRTDETGTGTMYLDPFQAYYITFEKEPYTLRTSTIVPQGTSYFVVMSGGGTTAKEWSVNTTYMIIAPTTNLELGDILKGIIVDPSARITEATFTIVWNGSVVYSDTKTVSQGVVFSVNTSDLNITTLDYWHPLKSKLCANFTDGTTQCVYDYGKTGGNDTGLKAAFITLSSDLKGSGFEGYQYVAGFFGGLFIALSGFAGPFVPIVVAFFLALVGFLPWWIAVFAGVAGIAIALSRGES